MKTSETDNLTMLDPDHQMKLFYPHRPWEGEPDIAEWFDARTGYKCRIERQSNSGTLCGYVGVFKGHPAYGLGYDDLHSSVSILVHGGLTYSNTDKNLVHWFGFDTAHAGDFCPGIAKLMLKYERLCLDLDSYGYKDETYRTWEYVEGEVHKLVNVLSKANVTWAER